jgi:hypothetical protein
LQVILGFHLVQPEAQDTEQDGQNKRRPGIAVHSGDTKTGLWFVPLFGVGMLATFPIAC